MAVVALLGFAVSVSAVVWEALADEGHEAVVPLDPDAVRALGHFSPDVLVLDSHLYLNTRAILDDLRRYPPTRTLPVVVTAPARPTQVPDYPGVWRLRPAFELAPRAAALDEARTWTGARPDRRHLAA
jgi:hypothetical protein